MGTRKFDIGDVVYFIQYNKIHTGLIERVMYDGANNYDYEVECKKDAMGDTNQRFWINEKNLFHNYNNLIAAETFINNNNLEFNLMGALEGRKPFDIVYFIFENKIRECYIMNEFFYEDNHYYVLLDPMMKTWTARSDEIYTIASNELLIDGIVK